MIWFDLKLAICRCITSFNVVVAFFFLGVFAFFFVIVHCFMIFFSFRITRAFKWLYYILMEPKRDSKTFSLQSG